MNEKTLFGASLVAGLVASLCCIGPLVFAVLGLGAFALARQFEALRPAFVALTGVLLAFGYYFAYRKPRASCEGEVCATPSYQKWGRPALWIVTVLAVGLALFPAWYGRVAAVPPVSQPSGNPQVSATVELKIDGMTCEVCASTVRKRLASESGVHSAEVSLMEEKARVSYDPRKTDPAKLIEAINSTGYKASWASSQKE